MILHMRRTGSFSCEQLLKLSRPSTMKVPAVTGSPNLPISNGSYSEAITDRYERSV